jgi:hypothetical protein
MPPVVACRQAGVLVCQGLLPFPSCVVELWEHHTAWFNSSVISSLQMRASVLWRRSCAGSVWGCRRFLSGRSRWGGVARALPALCCASGSFCGRPLAPWPACTSWSQCLHAIDPAAPPRKDVPLHQLPRWRAAPRRRWARPPRLASGTRGPSRTSARACPSTSCGSSWSRRYRTTR